jgi:glycosyltransferase involved in cell wall biosynthesis
VRICVIGKFPPIEGGVSMRTYWTAHALAMRGHDVHVVTNAKEVRPPFRMHMRSQDWQRCEAQYDRGSVTVHWTDPVDRSQSYIPMASPFVSKLAAIAARVHSECPFDVIYSHYLEPYGVAGHLAAQIAGVPHVARMAGSDAGRLWHHPQFEALYDHVLRSAEVVIAAGTVAERAIARGVAPDRIAYGGQFVVPEDLFCPDGPRLDLAALRLEAENDRDLRASTWGEFAGERPYFGVYGKLGENKGSFALLAAMHRLKDAGVEVGLVALAHGQPIFEKRFRARARKLGLTGRLLQIPFLPHWRVPEFLRSCLAVCCLEQGFPIEFHTPIISFEVLLCGTCLVASTEVIAKFPNYGRLPHGYGCVAIEDVNDIQALSSQLAAIVTDPGPAAAVGSRGRAFARDLQRDVTFPQTLEGILDAAAAQRRVSMATRGPTVDSSVQAENCSFPLTRLAEIEIEKNSQHRDIRETARSKGTIDLMRARDVLTALKRGIENGQGELQTLAPAVEIEIAIAGAEYEVDKLDLAQSCGALFRLHIRRWAMDEHDLAELVPLRDDRLRVLQFDFDVSAFLGVRTAGEFPRFLIRRRSYIVAFARANGKRRGPLVIDRITARILELSDGTRTAAEIVRQLKHEGDISEIEGNLDWIANLFICGLVQLHDARLNSGMVGQPDPKQNRGAGTFRRQW